MNVVSADGIGGMKKGPWTAAEDAILIDYVKRNGEGNWNAVQKNSGLSRCGKSCRLRWANHLRPNLKKGSFTPEEERIILELHSKIGNKWARMATQVNQQPTEIFTHSLSLSSLYSFIIFFLGGGVLLQLPGRTDNEIKNYWNTRIKRRQRSGLPLYPPDIQHRQNGFHNQSRLSPITLANETKPHFGGGNPHPHPLSHQTPISLFNSFPMSFSNGPTMAVPIPPQPQPQPLVGHHRHHHSVFPNSEAQTLFPRVQHLKRGREEGLDYSSMFGSNIVSTAVPMAVPMVRFGSRPNGPQLQQQNLSAFSMKMELPSSQYLPATASNHDSDPWVHETNSNSGLLDALLEDTHGSNRKISPASECIKRTDDNKTGDDTGRIKIAIRNMK